MRRSALLSFAIILVLVPALFDAFPELGDLPVEYRVAIIAAWLFVGASTARAALVQSERIEELVGQPLEEREKKKTLAAKRLLRLLLEERAGLPSHYTFRLYTLDELLQQLVPVFDTDNSSAQNWPIGRGVTGQAWKRGSYVVARGFEVSDGTYHLTLNEQKRYKHLQVVAALPIRDDRGQLVAVLAASSEMDDGRLVSEDGFDRHQELALIAGRILLDITGLVRG